MIRALVALLVTAGLACATAPAAQRAHAVAPGVHVGAVAVGGLLAVPARDRIAETMDTPLARSVGARLDVNAAVSAALAATPGSRIALPVHVAPARLDAFLATLAKKYSRAPVAPKVIGATDNGPEFAPAKPGIAVDGNAMRAEVLRSLSTHTPVKVVTHSVAAKHFTGAVIVVNRAENTLRLFHGTKLVRVFSVATGQSIYPTPAGIWHIEDKQMNPWWYPPTYDAWAKGLKPMPPGPGNPLGTRWMGLDAPGVGIHGTDAPTSIGYSASHGCIRMQIPDAEWLFPHVSVGTPVVIL